MIGATYEAVKRRVRGFKIIGASTWKNALGRRGFDLEAAYTELVDMSVPKRERLTKHQIDATLIGVYAAHLLAKLKGFEYVPSTKELRKMMERTQVISAAVPRKSRKTKTKR